MAAVGCLEKEIQFQKEAIKEQGVRQAKERLPTKKYLYPTRNITFPSLISRWTHTRPVAHPCQHPSYECLPPEPVSAPPRRRPSRGRRHPSRPVPARQHARKPSPILPASPDLFQTQGTPQGSPHSRLRDKIAPRKPKTGTCHPHRSKSFTGRGGPGGDAFSRAPSSPGKYPASSAKNYAPASASASPAASSEAGPARGASATERSGICHCPGRGAVSSAFSPT